MGVCVNLSHSPQNESIIKLDDNDNSNIINQLINSKDNTLNKIKISQVDINLIPIKINDNSQMNNKEFEISKKKQMNNSKEQKNLNISKNFVQNSLKKEENILKKKNLHLNQDNSNDKSFISNKNLVKPFLDLELIEENMKMTEGENVTMMKNYSTKSVYRPIFTRLLKHSKNKEKIK